LAENNPGTDWRDSRIHTEEEIPEILASDKRVERDEEKN
jgi:hypothetical protein